MQFRDLGPLHAEIDGDRLSLGGPKPTMVLAFLLVNANRRVATDALVDAVWGEQAPGSAVSTLESHLWRLRRGLEPARARGQASSLIINDAGGYRLLARPDQVDSLRFEQLADDVRRMIGDPQRVLARCDQALGLWRERPYAGLDRAWLQPVTARLEDIAAELHERRIDALLDIGQNDQALSDLARLIEAAPFRERLRGQRMLALCRTGRGQEALQTYQRARATLIEQLGVEPGPSLRDLHARILDQDPELLQPAWPATYPASSAAPAVLDPADAGASTDPAQIPDGDAPSRGAATSGGPATSRGLGFEPQLPIRATALIGRSTDLARLTDLLTTHHLVTVVGAAGCGKTRLAVEVAATLAERFADGVWFADLASIDQPDLVVDVVISAIGFAAPAVGTALDALHSYTRDRQLLIVLDNCEHLLPAVTDMAAVIAVTGAECAILATSREPTGVPGEVVWPLGPLPVESTPAAEADVSDRGHSPAVELFLARMLDADPTRILEPEDLSAITRICRGVDGIPLAIELAAARVRSFTPAEIAAQVTTDASSLRRLGRGPGDHRQSVRSAIEWSYRLLSADEQALHRRISVLPGAFTRTAAAAVAGHPPLHAADVPDLLAQLVHRSLLSPMRPRRPGGPTLYTQLATVRGHAAHALATSAETPEHIERRDEWVTYFLSTRPRLSAADHNDWYARVDDAYPTVRAALQHLLNDDPAPASGQLLSRLAVFWFYRHRTVEGDRWLDSAIALRDLDAGVSAQIHLNRAAHAFLRGRPDTARTDMDLAAQLIAQVGDDEDVADVVELLGPVALAAQSHNEYDAVAELADLAARTTQGMTGREDPDLTLLARALTDLAGTTQKSAPSTLADADALHAHAIDRNNLLVAWIAATIGSTLARNNAHAIDWIDRQGSAQLQLGAHDTGILAERRASYLTRAGNATEAVMLFAAARGYLRRAGLSWPFLPTTDQMLHDAEHALGTRRYQQAWQAGEQTPLAQLMRTPART